MKTIQTIRKSFGILSIAAVFAVSVLGGSLFVAGNDASAASASLRMYNRCGHARDVFVYNQSSMRLLWSGTIQPGQSAVASGIPTYITLKINSPKKSGYSYSVPSVYVYAPVALSSTICR